MFDLRGLSVAYDAEPVLRDISLRIQAGEKVVVVGPSGAGKSTLLKKLYELRQDDSAFVHQDYALVPQLSVFHNVCIGRLDFNGTLYNLLNLVRHKKEQRQRVQQILDALGIGDKSFALVHSLSGGQQQRVAVARAIYRNSSVLLGDEPVSSIDPHQANAVLQIIKGSSETVVLSLHDVDLALELFDRIVGLRAGRIVFDLPSAEVSEPMLADLFKPC